MGADMTEGTVAKWLKKEGDAVKRGDKMAEIETDKTVVEMEAYADGTLLKVVVPEGRKVPVGQLIAWIGQQGEKVPEEPGAPTGPAGPAARPAPHTATPAVPAPAATVVRPAPAPAVPLLPAPVPVAAAAESERIKASPIARKLAEERGIDLSRVPGTGPGGRITRDDVLNYKPAPALPGASASRTAAKFAAQDIPLSSMRQAIARVTVKSKTEAPHFYVTVAVDMSDTMNFRQHLNEAIAESGAKVSVNDMIIKAAVNALRKHPKFNTSFAGDRLAAKPDINIGIAIALEQGLLVPALLKCQGKSLIELSNMTRDLGNRARGKGGALTQAELTQGTFGISNLGMFDVESFAAIIVPGHAAILATGTVKKAPVVKGGQIAVADVMHATLSCDHRVADGAEAAIFLTEIKRNLENPALLMM
jgi:pyruvate dehydrogenase E2 component (dihydrolipoamide acetyltransferase)